MATKTAPKARISTSQLAAQRAQERQVALEQFEASRGKVWQGLWSRAMRLALLLQASPGDEVVQTYSWWFEDFNVNAAAQSFSCESSGALHLTEDTITMADAQRVDTCLATGQDYYDEFMARKAEEKRQREELTARKNKALEKLTPDERQLLSLPAVYRA